MLKLLPSDIMLELMQSLMDQQYETKRQKDDEGREQLRSERGKPLRALARECRGCLSRVEKVWRRAAEKK